MFECDLESRDLERLVARLSGAIVPAEDDVRLYRLCAACRQEITLLGRGSPPGSPLVYVV